MSCFSTFEAYSKFKLTSMKLNKDNNRGKPLATRKQVPFGSSKVQFCVFFASSFGFIFICKTKQGGIFVSWNDRKVVSSIFDFN